MADYYLKDVDELLWRRVKAKAAREGKSVKQVLMELLTAWVSRKKGGKEDADK